jgi:hypothetical protein
MFEMSNSKEAKVNTRRMERSDIHEVLALDASFDTVISGISAA